jgi:hypothetical protein
MYNGEWCAGKREGIGKMLWPDGSEYDGHWHDDIMHGRYRHNDLPSEPATRVTILLGSGTMTYSSEENFPVASPPSPCRSPSPVAAASPPAAGGPASYDGEWADGRRHGAGEMRFSDGRTYRGEWEAGAMHGRGVLSWADGGRYDGSFRLGQRCGDGKMAWADGRWYEGQWADDRMHGRGAMGYPNGRRSDGLWRRGWPANFAGGSSSPLARR